MVPKLACNYNSRKSHYNNTIIYNNKLLLRILLIISDNIFAVLSNSKQMNAYNSSLWTVLPPVGEDGAEGNINPNAR